VLANPIHITDDYWRRFMPKLNHLVQLETKNELTDQNQMAETITG
jgi:hypothetical protein